MVPRKRNSAGDNFHRAVQASMRPRNHSRGKGLPVTRCAATSRKPVCERRSNVRIFPFL